MTRVATPRFTGTAEAGSLVTLNLLNIVNSYVGPFTSIYHHCLVESSEIEHSIVLEHGIIRDLPHRLEDSLIGRYVEITRSPLKPRAYRLVLGDHSTVGVL